MCINTKTKEVQLWIGESSLPLTISHPFYAVGSGEEFAMALLHVGKTAIEAVKITSELCPSCGLGIDHIIIENVKVKKS